MTDKIGDYPELEETLLEGDDIIGELIDGVSQGGPIPASLVYRTIQIADAMLYETDEVEMTKDVVNTISDALQVALGVFRVAGYEFAVLDEKE